MFSCSWITVGGDNEEVSFNCTGGSRNVECFSSRLMWRQDGAGEMYTYLPPGLPGNDNVCNVPPLSLCNPEFGASIGRGSYKFTPGQWTSVCQRVKLNDAGVANGELEMFADGRSVFNVQGLSIRNSATGRIRGLLMETFFGGL
jgi:hypothetical protein